MKRMFYLSVTALSLLTLSGCTNSSEKTSKTENSKNEETLLFEVPSKVSADSLQIAEIKGKTTPHTEVGFEDNTIDEPIKSDENGNFTLKHRIVESEKQKTIKLVARNNDKENKKEVTIDQHPDVFSKYEAKEKAGNSKTPMEYLRALNLAKVYSAKSYLSKATIYDTLISKRDGEHVEDAAQYAIDNLEADYNKNALEKAKRYMQRANVPKEKIYSKLVDTEKFTPSEARYAMEHL